jgi:hypothetical protein
MTAIAVSALASSSQGCDAPPGNWTLTCKSKSFVIFSMRL